MVAGKIFPGLLFAGQGGIGGGEDGEFGAGETSARTLEHLIARPKIIPWSTSIQEYESLPELIRITI